MKAIWLNSAPIEPISSQRSEEIKAKAGHLLITAIMLCCLLFHPVVSERAIAVFAVDLDVGFLDFFF
jgi:hypothetical protein